MTPDQSGREPLPTTLGDRLRAPRCALVVIDMQNDFCAPGGFIDKVMNKDLSGAAAAVPAMQGLLDAARAARVPVFWVIADYSHDRIPRSMLVKLQAQGIRAECCKPGTWGADWFGVRSLAGEPVVTKHTYSGFHATSLQQHLAQAGVETLVFAGVQTQVCVESTVRDAHSRGYYCVVARDAVASHTPALHDAALANIRFLFGDVCDAAEIQRAWSAPPESCHSKAHLP